MLIPAFETEKAFEARYLDAAGTVCPFCGSDEITGGFVEIDGGLAEQEMMCLDCESVWHDLYSLSHIESVNLGLGPRFLPVVVVSYAAAA